MLSWPPPGKEDTHSARKASSWRRRQTAQGHFSSHLLTQKGERLVYRSFPSEIRAHSKQGAAVNISDKTLLLPWGTVSSNHQSLQWVLPPVQQSQETWRQRRPPLPPRYKSTLLHKDARFFAQAGIVLQEGETSLLLKGRDCLYIGRHPKIR